MQDAKIGGIKEHIECPISNNVMLICINQLQLLKVLSNCNKLVYA